MKHFFLLLFGVLLIGCKNDAPKKSILFDLKENQELGIDFRNDLGFSNDFNVYKYRNYYNGGGVAIGDVNNDNLPDIYFVANQDSNRLYINQGNWKFKDVTKTSGTAGQKAWSTGVSMVDINSDGFVDIYVSNSGDVQGDDKENELFINNGDLTFTEAAAEYNLNDEGFSTHASFFDYDKDGDLDAYILNNSFQAIGSFNLRKNERPKRDKLGGDKLLKNEGGKFIDVSEEAGIYGSVIGFGLGITIGDVNNDTWDDIFISNDFFERDYLYINQQDGTFKESLVEMMPSISGASMGADIADIDNDGNQDIFVTEMLPSEYERLKTVTTFDDWDRYKLGVDNGYHHQYTRNTLHHNNGNNTFSEISRLLGVEASDWSWGALFFDMDNDGHKDLFIANGIYRDLTNQDYLQYIANESVLKTIVSDDGVDYRKLIDIIPSNMVSNHAYKNKGNLNFESYTESGLLTPGFSNGSAYGDLDNDGDLDLVVNNVNMPCFIYENHADKAGTQNYIKLNLKGIPPNPHAVGSKITVSSGENQWHYEQQPIRGFQSSVDMRPNIGVGSASKVDIEIIWPKGAVSVLKDIDVNQTITVDEKDGKSSDQVSSQGLNSKFSSFDLSEEMTHKENWYIDFNRERLNYHMLSTRGPCVSYADVDNDGQKELIIPGAKGTESKIFTKNGDTFTQLTQEEHFNKMKESEHVKCDLFDADNDGDLDMYLASGGVELTKYSELLYDKLLINDGNGQFQPTQQRFPVEGKNISTGAIASGDVDGDGDEDIFVGERVKVGEYGAPCSGYILLNDGQGQFEDATEKICPDLKSIGMVTDATFEDLDNDGKLDLIVIGEFMDVQIYQNDGSKLIKKDIGAATNGWWNVLKIVDIENDGDRDIVLGNHGLNSRFRASEQNPIKMFFADYDNNGFPEGIMAKTREDGNDYPYALRHNLTKRLPHLKKKYPDFETYKQATMVDIFGEEVLNRTDQSMVNELRSVILRNDGAFSFEKIILPESVQVSPIYAIEIAELNGDGFPDILMGGNLYNVQPEMGRYDASYGHALINDGKGNYEDQSNELGLSIKGEIRDFVVTNDSILVFRNNDSVVGLKIQNND